MKKDIFSQRILSLTSLLALCLHVHAQDCESNLGSTSFKAAGDASSWQYYDIANVVTEGPSGVSLSTSLSKPGDMEELSDGKSQLVAVASNPYKLNAVIADPTLEDGVDYDSDTLMFKDMPGNVVVLNYQGAKTAELLSVKIPNAKSGTEFKIKYTLCNVLNPNSPSVQAAIPSYMMQNPGWESGYELKDINVGLSFDAYGNFGDKPASGTHNYAQGEKPLTMADGCKTYTYVSTVPATSSNMTFTIGTSHNATFNFAVKDIEVTGCFDPKINCSAGIEVCQGEQVPLTLDRAYNASSYKWERSTNGGSSWETISTTPSALDELEKTSMYRCIVDGQESNTLTVKAMTCCVVDGKPASRKNVFNETFGYFTGPYDYVDSEGNETTLSGTNVAYRTGTSFAISDHKLDLTGQVNDGTYAVLVPTPLGYNLDRGDFNPNNPATWMDGVTADHTSAIDGRENGAALFINVQENFKGTIFENTIDGLCPGKSLSFECYIANLSGGSDPLVTINLISPTTGKVLTDVNGKELIKENVVASAGGGWIKCSIDDILLKDESSVIVQIIADCGNQCNIGSYWTKGNDLIIDDIKFMTCAPPQISAYYDESTLQLDTTVCSDAELEVVMPETELLKNFFSGKQNYVLQYSIDKKNWNHLRLSKSNSIKFNSDEVTEKFTDPEKVYMRVIVASEATAKAFESDPNMASSVDVCSDYSISDPFTITIDCPTCTASEDIEIISSEKASVENKVKTVHLCKGESVTLSSNDVATTTEKGDPYSNFLMTWTLDGVKKSSVEGSVAEKLEITWEDATEEGLSVKLISEDADYPGQKDCMKEAEIVIVADPVPDATIREPEVEFCEGEGKGLVDLTLTKGTSSDYTIHWWKGADTLTGTPLGDDKEASFFEGLESTEGGTFSYQLEDAKTGCKGEVNNYKVDVYPIPDAPKEESIQYTINGVKEEILTTEKFSQTLDETKTLVWYTSGDPAVEPKKKGTPYVAIDRSVATTKPYVFYIAYREADANGGCFSERAKVEVEVLAAPAPSVKDIDLCKDGTYDAMDGISATDEGYELVWFENPNDTVGKALPSAPTSLVDVTKPGKYTLYVAQRATTSPYAQSEVVSFDVTVYDVKAPKDASKLEYCANDDAEELKGVIVKDEPNYYYADEIVYVFGADEQSTFVPDTKRSTTQKYEYSAYQKFTTPESKQVCTGPSIDVVVDVIAVPNPVINQPTVSYVKSEAQANKEFVDILVKAPEAIEDVPGQTLLWSKEEFGVFVKGSTPSSKPTYDELAPVGEVEKQERWVIWEATTASGMTCKSNPEKINITISSTPAPIVKKIEICEEVFKTGTIPTEKEPGNNASKNDNDGKLPDASLYELVWFTDAAAAEAAMTDDKKLALGTKTAPSLTTVFSGVNMTDKTVSEWTKSLFVVQSYNGTTSPATEMKLTVNATPKLQEIAQDPVCNGPVNLTDNKYWNVSNGVKVDAVYEFGGSETKNASSLTKGGEYTITGTSSLGCKSDPLTLQLDIRTLSISMDPKSETCPGDNVTQDVKIDFVYNKDGAEATANNVKLTWKSEEKTSSKPTNNGTAKADDLSITYVSGNFDGKAGDTHLITVEMTDGYCTASTKQIVEIGNGPAGGSFTWKETGNASLANGKSIPLSDSNKDKIEINACGEPVTVDFSNVAMDAGSKVEWFKTQDYTATPYKTDAAPVFAKNDYGTYYVRYMNHCYAYATVKIIDASVTISTLSDGNVVKCENDEYKKEIDVVCNAGKPTRYWYKDGAEYVRNSDGLSFSPLMKKDQGEYSVEYVYDGCSAKLDVVDLKVKEYVKVDVADYEMYEGKKSYIHIAGEDAKVDFKFTVPSSAADVAALKSTMTDNASRNQGSMSSDNSSFTVDAVDEDHKVKVVFENDDYCEGETEFQVLRDAKLILHANVDTAMCLTEKKPFSIDTIGTGAFRRPGWALKVTSVTETGKESQEKGFLSVMDTLKKDISPVVTTTYNVLFTYGSQKKDTTIKVTVYNFKVEPVNLTICSGEEITLNAKVTPAGSKIEWFDKDGITSLGENPGTLTPEFDPTVSAAKSTYKYWARPYSDVVTCKNSDPYPLKVDIYRPLEGKVEDQTICEGDNVRVDAGSYGATKYTWIIGEDTIRNSSRYYQDTPTETTVYKVHMTRGEVCEADDEATVTVATRPVIESIDSVNYREVDIKMAPDFGTPEFRYSIDGGEWTENTHLTGLTYTIHTIKVEDALGCVLLDTFVVKDPAIEPPYWFSPNGDGEYDRWTVPGIQETYPEAEFTIYDRWGKKLVEFKGSDEGWDGLYNGSAMPSTDYWYELVVREIDKIFTGHFTLIRR